MKEANLNFRTGRLLHGYGNVKATQGLHSESFELHHRALKQYMATIGGSHHRTADICHKVAEHHARLGENEKAMFVAQFFFDQGIDC